MFNKKTGSVLMAAFLALSVIGGIGTVTASHSDTDVYVGNATEMGVDESTHTVYSDLQTAFTDASDNQTIAIENGTYVLNNTLDSNASNLTVNAYSGNVTIDGTNTTSGEVFTNATPDSWSFGENVIIETEVLSGGGLGSVHTSDVINTFMSPTDTVYGIPVWVLYMVLLLLGFAGYDYWSNNQ